MAWWGDRQQMHEAYRERVDQWIKDAPTTEWSKGYAKENYSKEYMYVQAAAAVFVSLF